ncbi:allophanate hydrolase subunit 1 [Angustibacter peucedani]
MTELVLRAVGDAGVVADLPDLGTARDLHRALVAAPPPGVVDLVPGARSVLVRVRPGTDLAAVARAVRAAADRPSSGGPAARREPVVVPVRYDGPDLDAVAELTGLSRDEVVAAHTGTAWTVAFMGFAPGFAYLAGGDPRLDVPRRDHPRPRVDPGAVGLAGGLSGVYPRASPGGWQLVGRTDLPLWDLHRDPPALLAPGRAVRFEAVP